METAKTRVLALDDHDIVRDGLRDLVNKQPDMEMVADARNGQEALEKTRSLRPDVILIDIGLPGMDGLAVVSHVKEISPSTEVVIFSMHNKGGYVHKALSHGALGYVLKTSSSSEILEAIRMVKCGKYFLSASIEAGIIETYVTQSAQRAAPKGYDTLSEREQGIFRLMVEGKSTKEIADVLCLSPKTVEKHRSSVMRKLDVHTLLEMMKYAVKIGLVDPDLWEP